VTENTVQTSLTRILGISGGLALASVLACQASRPPPTPGALPTAQGDVTPRLNAATYVAHGHLLEEQGQWQAAVAAYRQALQLAPELVTARNRLGVTLNKLGRHHEASTELRAAVQRSPGTAFLHNNLGFSLYLEGHYAEAERALARAVELQPTFRRAHMNHGLVLAKLNRFDEALAAFCLAGPPADAHYNVAILQTEAGRYIEAVQSLQRALELNPQLEEARVQLREVARLAAAQEAEAVARAAVAAPPEEVETVAVEPILTDAIESVADCEELPLDVLPGDSGTDEDLAEQVWQELSAAASLLPGFDLMADLGSGLGRVGTMVVHKARTWEATLQRVAGELGLRDRPY
jgi:Flp pilus assembly protein TadD